MRKSILATAAIVAALAARADDGINYMPQFHGVVKGNWEIDTDNGESRFLARNARLGATGKIAPMIDYKIEADFCDRGDFKMLDAWGGIMFSERVKAMLGQSVMPFGVDAPRATAMYPFTDTSFLGILNGPIRNVGVKGVWSKGAVSIAGAVFNNYAFAKQKEWQGRAMAYAVKADWKVPGGVTATCSFRSNQPEGAVRVNSYDVSLGWESEHLWAEGEFMHKHYTNKQHAGTDGWNVMGGWRTPVKLGCFNRLGLQGRYDGMTANSDGTLDEGGRIYTTTTRRQRATVGVTLSYLHLPVRADIHLNYMHYFHPSGIVAAAGERNKVTAQLVVRF